MYKVTITNGVATIYKERDVVFKIGMGDIISAEINSAESMVLISYKGYSELRDLTGKLLRIIKNITNQTTKWIGNYIVLNRSAIQNKEDLRNIQNFRPRIL